jgi:hypothetical protein
MCLFDRTRLLIFRQPVRDLRHCGIHPSLIRLRVGQLDQMPACPMACQISSTIENIVILVARDHGPASFALAISGGIRMIGDLPL